MSDSWGPAEDQSNEVERRGGGQSNPAVARILVLLGSLIILGGGFWRITIGDSDDPTAVEPSAITQYGWLGLVALGFLLVVIGVTKTNRSR